jgi:hypothetical protein
MGTLHEDLRNLMTTAQWILIRMQNIADKFCRENQNTHFVFNKYFSKICSIYEIMWKYMVQPDKKKITI